MFIDEATLPDEEAYEFAAVAPDPSELARQWQRFRLGGTPPHIDFDRNVVLFVGFGESGSCPYEYGGVDIDDSQKRLSFVDASTHSGGCNADYNPRTLGLRIDRRLLPDGVFQVTPPIGGDVSVAADRVPTAPQEGPDVVSATISDVFVSLDPEPVTTDGRLAVGVHNASDEWVAAASLVRLDRWTGLGFEPADPSLVEEERDAMVAGPNAEERLLVIDVAAQGLAPAWYRVTVDLDVTTGDYGRLLIRRAFEVVQPSAG